MFLIFSIISILKFCVNKFLVRWWDKLCSSSVLFPIPWLYKEVILLKRISSLRKLFTNLYSNVRTLAAKTIQENIEYMSTSEHKYTILLEISKSNQFVVKKDILNLQQKRTSTLTAIIFLLGASFKILSCRPFLLLDKKGLNYLQDSLSRA